jgi:hypothetical protein
MKKQENEVRKIFITIRLNDDELKQVKRNSNKLQKEALVSPL